MTETQIQEAERQMGARLPADYREFIRDFGGFSLYAEYSIDPSLGGKMSISEFNAIISDKNLAVWDIVTNYLTACKESDIWNEEWLHLGSSGGSQSIAFAFKGPEIGSVYTFDFDYEYHPVASSFDEFINLLQKGEEFRYDVEDLIEQSPVPSFWDTFST